MCFFGKSKAEKAAEASAAQTRSDEDARQARITSGMANINKVFDDPTTGFTDDFYNKQGQAYTDYATPQLEHQYGQAKDSLVYALSRSGLLDSTAGQKQNAELNTENDQALTDIAGQAHNVENTARSNVESTRANLVSQLNATGDDQAAAAAAVRGATNLYQPQGYSPLTDMFSNIAQTVAGIGSNAKNDYSGFTGGSGLFSTGRGSSTVVR